MQFVKNGNPDLKDENVFDTFELADYLQMGKLKICCLDQFTSSLNRDNVQTKFNFLKQLSFPIEEFKQRALSFIENISCGLYFMHFNPSFPCRSHLKMFSEENNTFCEIGCHARSDLHCFDNTLVMCPSSTTTTSTQPRRVSNVIMYDLITGKTNGTTINFEGPVVNCSNDKSMFVISGSKEKSRMIFYIETFNIINYSEFYSSKKEVGFILLETYTTLSFHFAHFFDDKVYVFFQTSYRNLNPFNNQMMIICTKSMRILKSIDLAGDRLFLGDEIFKYRYSRKYLTELTRCSNLSKFFYFMKESKLFILFEDTMEECNLYLVFDIKNQQFYVKKDFLQLKEKNENTVDIRIASKGDKFYGIFSMCESSNDSIDAPIFDENSDYEEILTAWEEIRIFKFENEMLVDTGVKWKSGKQRIPESEDYDSWVTTSKLFVQSIKLN